MKNIGTQLVCFGARHVRVLLVAFLLMVGVVTGHATEDANELLVDGAVTSLTTTFGTVFVLGLGVVIAMIAKKYLRRAA